MGSRRGFIEDAEADAQLMEHGEIKAGRIGRRLEEQRVEETAGWEGSAGWY